MSTELGLDPTDPLNLLLHNEDEDSEAKDWAKYTSSLWPEQSLNLMDFSMNLDVDYSSMGIDPTELHFNPAGLNFAYDDQNPINYADPYHSFSFQCPPQLAQGPVSTSPQSFTKERRLSITSSSSSSGASLSPMPEPASSPPSGYTSDNLSTKEESTSTNDTQQLNFNDPAAELAHRVRQTAGVMLAVPMSGFAASFQAGATAAAGKLPIPRLARPSSVSSSSKSNASTSSISSAASTPPPSTPASCNSSPSLNPAVAPSVSVPVTPATSAPVAPIPRPKTSHTTIERRYRTNLNARIQSLRMAVPALRVLEDRDGSNGKKIKKNIKGGVIVKGAGIGIECPEDGSVLDVIDERGFVDGVKVARKCSKANVLGKAVEYIRVLKKREQRLKAEQAGLKALISGLVGGPALIREWERQWRVKFGGEERDEVEGEDEEGDDDESEDDDGDDGDEEGGARKRKRTKVVSSSSTAAPSTTAKKPAEKKEKKPAAPVVLLNDGNGNVLPEKRKRGRPRKVQPAPPIGSQPVVIIPSQPEVIMPKEELMQPEEEIIPPHWQQIPQSQPQQFLLAVFAIFSFFNSPLTSSMGGGHGHGHHVHHTGKVLTGAAAAAAVHPPLAYAPEIISQFVPPSASQQQAVGAGGTWAWAWKEYVQLFHLLVTLLVLASLVGNWFGFSGLGWGVNKVIKGRSLSLRRKSKTWSGAGLMDWVKLGEESVLEGDAPLLSHFERFQIYRAVTSKRNPTVSDLATAAMVMQSTTGIFRGLARMKAQSIWNTAKQKLHMKVTEQLVMNSMDVREACAHIASATMKSTTTQNNNNNDSNGDQRKYTPLEVLGCVVVKERVKDHLGKLFVEAVVTEEVVIESDHHNQNQKREEQERRKTVEGARELGGVVEDLGRLFERAWKTDSVELEDVELVFGSDNGVSVDVDDEEIRSLFVALVLYTRLFGEDGDLSTSETECPSSMSSSTVTFSSSTLLSPPPTPRTMTMTMMADHHQLMIPNGSGRKRVRMLSDLRKVLGSRVFEEGGGGGGGGSVVLSSSSEGEKAFGLFLEDAKDKVVDLIVDIERRERVALKV